jgi:hypothetical protein
MKFFKPPRNAKRYFYDVGKRKEHKKMLTTFAKKLSLTFQEFSPQRDRMSQTRGHSRECE